MYPTRVLLLIALALPIAHCAEGGETGGTDTAVAADTATTDSAGAPPDTVSSPDTTVATDAATPHDTAPSDTTAPADTTAPVDTTPGDTGAPPTVTTMSVKIGPFSVPAGVERTMCATVDLGNVDPAMIVAVRTHLSEGSHHLIVHRLFSEPDPTPTPCNAFAHGQGAETIFIAQQAEAGMAYPDQAGLHVQAHQTIGLEMHYINYFTDDAADIEGVVEFDLVPPQTGWDEVRLAFLGPLGFRIDANSDGRVIYFTRPSSAWRILAMTSHTHQLGTHATIHAAASKVDDTGELLHESTSWADPPLTRFEPPYVLPDDYGLKLTCDYTNPNPFPVTFGVDFDDEMCFMWVYYLLPR